MKGVDKIMTTSACVRVDKQRRSDLGIAINAVGFCIADVRLHQHTGSFAKRGQPGVFGGNEVDLSSCPWPSISHTHPRAPNRAKFSVTQTRIRPVFWVPQCVSHPCLCYTYSAGLNYFHDILKTCGWTLFVQIKH